METNGQLNIKSNTKGNKVIQNVDFNQILAAFLELMAQETGKSLQYSIYHKMQG